MRKYLWLVLLFFVPFVTGAQTTVNLTVSDTPDAQTWNSGTWTATLQMRPGQPPPSGAFQIISGGGSVVSQSGSLSATGTAAIPLPANANINPSQSVWSFSVCPQATWACYQSFVTVSTSSPQTLAINPPSIRINFQNATPPVTAYTNAEVVGASLGSQYYNLVSGTYQICSISASPCTWVSGGVSNGSNISVNGQFNVKNYGAVGDAHFDRTVTTSSSTLIATATDSPWATTDVGKFIQCVNPATGTAVLAPTVKITGFTNANSITVSAVGTGSAGAGNFCVWFTQDDTAAFGAAWAAAHSFNANLPNQSGGPTTAYQGTLGCPPGGYAVSGPVINENDTSGSTLGVSFIALGPPKSCIIYPLASFVAATTTNKGANSSGVLNWFQALGVTLQGIMIEGSFWLNTSNAGFTGYVTMQNCNTCNIFDNFITDTGMSGSTTYDLYLQSWSGTMRGNVIQNGPANSIGGNDGACFFDAVAQALIENNICSNHAGASMTFQSSGSRNSTQLGFTLINNTHDECGTITYCTLFSASVVNMFGDALFGGAPAMMNIDATSQVYATDINCQQFGSGSANIACATIASGGFMEATGSTLFSNGTNGIITGPAGATFVDNGGNTWKNCVSGTCTAISAATYATLGFTGGIIPKASVTHTPNTCYDVTSPAALASTLLCNQLLDQNYQILNISASSTTVTTCATAPVVTITDGTRSATLTLTTAKSAWVSTVDASTGIDSVFASGGTMTVTYDTNAGACATPPTNLAVSFVLQSVVNF